MKITARQEKLLVISLMFFMAALFAVIATLCVLTLYPLEGGLVTVVAVFFGSLGHLQLEALLRSVEKESAKC